MPNTTPLPVPSQALYQLTPCRPHGFGAVSAGPATSSESVSALNSSLAFNLLRTVRTTAASPDALRRVIILAVRDGEYRGHRGRLGGDAEDPLLLCQLIN